MQFYSTRNHSHKKSFKQALFKNLAPDGGLYMPDSIPKFTSKKIEMMRTGSLQKVAYRVLKKFIDDIPESNLKKIIGKSYGFPIPLKKMGENFYLELFHGPTMAFKDFGVGTLAKLIEHVILKNKKIA